MTANVDLVTDHQLLVHQLIEAQAAQIPEAIAVVCETESITYADLNQRANQLARYLQQVGVGTECVVGLCLERSIDMIVAVLGVLKAGAAYLPIDPHYPIDRQCLMLQDSRASAVLFHAKTANAELEALAPAIWIDRDWAAIAAHQPTPNLVCVVHPHNLAYVIYTSGSTGRPKGVMIEHRAIANHMEWIEAALTLSSADRVVQKTPFSFDASVWEFFAPLLVGGQLIIARPGGHQDARYLSALIQSHGVTVLQVVPSLLRMLVQEPLFDSCTMLRIICCGGEALPSELAQQVLQCRPVRLFNLYGPTEATIDATWAELTPSNLRQPTAPLGHPILNLETWVLNEDMQKIAPGSSGELYIAGDGLARGYYQQPAWTAERFLPHPFSLTPGARLYKTGDLVRQTADGMIEFLGRLDQQIKIRGFRVEAREIEAVIEQYAGVQQSLVVGQPDASGTLRLVAYVTSQDVLVTADALTAYLKVRLPSYMVPSHILCVPAFPLLPNGKIDRGALPAAPTFFARPASGAPPQTALQHELHAIWTQVLNIPELSIDADFFELGGHSLLAMQLTTRLCDTLQIEWSVTDVFANPTIRKQAELLAAAGSVRGARTQPVIRRVAREHPVPLTHMQERVWFLSRLNPESRAYHFQMTVAFSGHLDVPVMEAVCTEIIRRHEILRTSFHEADGQPFQQIHNPWRVTIPSVDLRHLPADERSPAMEDLIDDALKQSFDLSSPRLVRWIVFQLTDDESVLLQIEHHFVHDGWSIAVLLNEIKTLYSAFLAGEPSSLPELPIQYADVAIWQRQQLAPPWLDSELAYWRQLLAHSTPVLDLPTDFPRPAIQSMAGASVRAIIPAALAQKARAFGQQTGNTMFMTMLAAFASLLSRYSGQQDLLFGSGVANRRMREIEPLIGMFVNTIVLRVRLHESLTFRELVSRVRAMLLERYDHQDVPFDKLVESLNLPRDLSRNPLFQVMFSFHDSPVPELQFARLRGTILERNNGSAKADLNVIVIPYAEQQGVAKLASAEQAVTMIWEYSTDLFRRETIESFISHYLILLEHALDTPDRQIGALPLFDRFQEHAALTLSQGVPALIQGPKVLHQLFDAQAHRHPDQIAVVCEGRLLTYGELYQRANLLAARLRLSGVQKGGLVGIFVERSTDLVIAIMAVLKAGAAYIPLDPAYPEERLALMIDDSTMQHILTNPSLSPLLPAYVHDWVLDVTEVLAVSEANLLKDASAPADLAYVMYTSGSTGRPKGVMCQHEGVINLLDAIANHAPLEPPFRGSLWTSFSFDVSVYELFSPLCYGGSLYIPSEDIRTSPLHFFDWLAECAIESAYLPPFMLTDFLAWLDRHAGQSSLKRLLVGVEPIPEELLARIQQRVPTLQVINGYGPTETTVCASLYAVPADTAGAGVAPIGRPVQRMAVYVLDSNLTPLPKGAIGDIYIGGIGVGLGYLHQPGLTASCFLPDHLSAIPGGRLYCTGDQGYYRNDGMLVFVGRRDSQIKLRGLRIELNEIAIQLLRHPGVLETCVVVSNAPGQDPQLLGYVRHDPCVLPHLSDLHRFLRASLPQSMIPTLFIPVDKFPLLPSGKIDRRSLPVPAAAALPDQGHAAPTTELEQIIAEVLGQILQRPEPGVQANFFELGLHSLMAARVASALQQRLQCSVPLRVFFEYPTVAELAAHIETIRARAMNAEERQVRVNDLSLLSDSDIVALLENIDDLAVEDLDRLLRQVDSQKPEL